MMLAGLVAYGVALIVSTHAGPIGIESLFGRHTIALLPMLPALWIGWTILRVIRSLDEMQRRIQLESMVFAFAGTALLTFSYGFLEGDIFPRLSMFVVWPLMPALWVTGQAICWLRYR